MIFFFLSNLLKAIFLKDLKKPKKTIFLKDLLQTKFPRPQMSISYIFSIQTVILQNKSH